MFDRIIKYFTESVNDEEFSNYLLRPINEGKHYHIGGVSELMDNTIELSCEDVEELICEKLVDIPEDVFTLEYYLDMDTEGVAKAEVKDVMIIMCQKISPNVLLVMEFVGCEDDMAFNPIIAIVPLGLKDFDYRAEDFGEIFLNYLKDDGVKEEFIGALIESPAMTTIGDVCYFSLDPETDSEDSVADDAIEDLRSSAVNVLYRFLLLKKQGQEVCVTPNTTLDTKGYLKLREIPKDCYVIKSPDGNEFLGFTRRTPEC